MSRACIIVCWIAVVAALAPGCARSRLRDTGSPDQAGDGGSSNPTSSSTAGVGAAGDVDEDTVPDEGAQVVGSETQAGGRPG